MAGDILLAIAECLHDSDRVNATVEQIHAALTEQEDTLWGAKIGPLLDNLADGLEATFGQTGGRK